MERGLLRFPWTTICMLCTDTVHPECDKTEALQGDARICKDRLYSSQRYVSVPIDNMSWKMLRVQRSMTFEAIYHTKYCEISRNVSLIMPLMLLKMSLNHLEMSYINAIIINNINDQISFEGISITSTTPFQEQLC